MELESLRYFMEVAKSLNITQTSERLYISQQTLSNHIRRVEEYYGTPLFNRQPRLQLTDTGQQVLNYAEKVFEHEKTLFSVLSDIGNSDVGQITIGVTTPRCNAYLPQVLQKYTRLYPRVRINSVEGTNQELEHLIQKNQLDFAVGGYIENSLPNVQIHSTHEDSIYLCVPDSLLYEYYSPDEITKIKKKSANGAEIADFSRLPFMLPVATNRLGGKIHQCFQAAHCNPNIYFESKHTTMVVPLCNLGLSAGFTSHMNLSYWLPQLNDTVNTFRLCQNGKPVMSTIRLISHKQRYLSRFVKIFMEYTNEALNNLEQKDLSRIVWR